MRALLLVIAFFPLFAAAQTAPDKYWIQFTDKNDTPYSLSNPSAFLSERAIERRERYNIGYDSDDLPINPDYIQSVLDLGEVELIHQSKWFNAITVKITEPSLLVAIGDLPFVQQTRGVELLSAPSQPEVEQTFTRDSDPLDTSAYGGGLLQLEMLNGQLMHALGYTGKGMHIAVMDAGFSRVQELPVFERLREEGRLTEVDDLVEWWDTDVNTHSNHGMNVLSCMGGYLRDSLIGTAPDASYFLFRTEEGSAENVIEEDNWVVAVEMAESMGVDLVNTSLGYSEFDDPSQDHTYADMDGRTTRISIAATTAARKGMLMVTSAGNKGASAWRYITAPADADSIITVGAVNRNELHAAFSSFGPSADGRVKPNVVALGSGTWIANADSTFRLGNGTSFSGPVLCGMAACLWQAHPEKNNMEILHAIEQSAHLATSPNDSLGYGIPDFWKAHLLLREAENEPADAPLLYPNPVTNQLNVEWKQGSDILSAPKYRIFDISGRLISEGCLNYFGTRVLGKVDLDPSMSEGLYHFELTVDGSTQVVSFVKSDL